MITSLNRFVQVSNALVHLAIGISMSIAVWIPLYNDLVDINTPSEKVREFTPCWLCSPRSHFVLPYWASVQMGYTICRHRIERSCYPPNRDYYIKGMSVARNEQLIRQHKVIQILERRRYGVTLEDLRDSVVQELGIGTLHVRSIRTISKLSKRPVWQSLRKRRKLAKSGK